MVDKIKTTLRKFADRVSVQRYVDTPVAGRLPPQTNDRDMALIVKWLLRVK
jgi:hypothetical protein